jgi:hypothetical protein
MHLFRISELQAAREPQVPFCVFRGRPVAHALAGTTRGEPSQVSETHLRAVLERQVFPEPAPSRSRLGNEVSHGRDAAWRRSYDPSGIAIPGRAHRPRTSELRQHPFRIRAATVREPVPDDRPGCGWVSGERAAATLLSPSAQCRLKPALHAKACATTAVTSA